jgi:hypothetical protein
MIPLRGRAALQRRSIMNRTKRAQEILRRPTSVFLILILVVTSLVPLALDSDQGGRQAGAIIDSGAAPDPTGTDQGSPAEGSSSGPSGPPEINDTSNGTQEVTPTPVEHDGSDDFDAAALSSNLTVDVATAYTPYGRRSTPSSLPSRATRSNTRCALTSPTTSSATDASTP